MLEIPKKIHRIWVGPKMMSRKNRNYETSWKKNNPTWEIITWGNDNIKTLKYFEKSVYEKCCNWAEKADYLRIIILLEHGWVYVDTDIECIKSIETLCENLTFFAWYWDDGWIWSGIIGSVPEQRILRNIISDLIKQLKYHTWQHDVRLIGVKFFSECIKKMSLEKEEKIYWYETFYPIPPRYMFWEYHKIPENSYTIHYGDYSWWNKKQKIITFLCRFRFFKNKYRTLKKNIYQKINIGFREESNEIKIWFIIPTYRRPELLIRTIKSVLCQKKIKDRLVIIDDEGEKNNNLYQFLEKTFNDDMLQNIIYIQNIKNEWLNSSRNVWIEILQNKVDYITFIDDDDYIIDGALQEFEKYRKKYNWFWWYLLPVRFSSRWKTYIKNELMEQDYVLDYVLGNNIRWDASHFISTKLTLDSKFPPIGMNNEQFLFFEKISQKTNIFTIPITFLDYNYQIDGMTFNKYYNNIQDKIYPRFFRIIKNISWIIYIVSNYRRKDFFKICIFWIVKMIKDLSILTYYSFFLVSEKILGRKITKNIARNIISVIFKIKKLL